VSVVCNDAAGRVGGRAADTARRASTVTSLVRSFIDTCTSANVSVQNVPNSAGPVLRKNVIIHSFMVSTYLCGDLGAVPQVGSRGKAPEAGEVYIFSR